MKKRYIAPKAKKIDFVYDEQIVAESAQCSGEIRHFKGGNCDSWRLNTPIVAKSSDPCYFESNAQE